MNIVAKSISKKSLFKLYLNTFGLGLFLFSVLMGVFALFGSQTVEFNGTHYTGLVGLIASIGVGVFLALWFTIFLWVIGIVGMWVNAKFYGLDITLRGVVEDELPEATTDVTQTEEDSLTKIEAPNEVSSEHVEAEDEAHATFVEDEPKNVVETQTSADEAIENNGLESNPWKNRES